MLAGVRHFAVSAIGRDRPGIVARVTGVLLRHGINVEDSQMTNLRGHFTMMLIVGAPDDVERERLDADLAGASEELGLEALSVQDVDELDPSRVEPSHTVSVYGVDHPGIVHGVTAALAERGVNITDLNTRLVGGDQGEPLYALMMEVTLPGELSPEELRGALEAVARHESVEVTLRELEQDAL
jgi:glycine cleavage system transcriptional repressor